MRSRNEEMERWNEQPKDGERKVGYVVLLTKRKEEQRAKWEILPPAFSRLPGAAAAAATALRPSPSTSGSCVRRSVGGGQPSSRPLDVGLSQRPRGRAIKDFTRPEGLLFNRRTSHGKGLSPRAGSGADFVRRVCKFPSIFGARSTSQRVRCSILRCRRGPFR